MSPTDASRTSVKPLARPAFWIGACAALSCALGAVWSLADPVAGQVKREFHFNASASALGGTIHRLDDENPPRVPRVPLFVQASSSLAPAGGISVADQGKYRYWDIDDPTARPIVSYEDAHTRTTGRELPDGCHQTTVMSIVNGFNVLDRLTADVLEVALTMKRCPNDDRDADLRVEACKIENLKIDGVPIQTECDRTLMEQHKLSVFLNKQAARTKQKPATENSMLQLSLINAIGESDVARLNERKKFKDSLRYKLLDGNGIYVPDFGNVYVGRFMVGPNKREVSMLRLVLGSPVGAVLDGGEVVVNGSYCP
jgi:hypothetical protein